MMQTVAALAVVVLALTAPGPARAAQTWLAGSMAGAGAASAADLSRR